MREVICGEVLRRLQKAGVSAVMAYSRPRAAEEAVVTVDLQKAESREAGLGSYLGESYNEENSCWQEEYGRRVSVMLALDAYAPRSAGAAGCGELLGKVHEVLTMRGSPFGETAMEWNEVRWDKDSGMFLQRGTISCTVVMIAAVEEENHLLLDFRLKGAVKNGHSGT